LSVAGHFKLRDPFFEFKVASCRQTHGVYQRNREPEMLGVSLLTGSEEGKCFSYTGGWFWHHSFKQMFMASFQHCLHNAHIVTQHEVALSV